MKYNQKIRVAILEDFPMIVDGYLFHLNNQPDIEVVSYAYYGEKLIPMLEQHPIDVLILDIEVPISEKSNELLNTLDLVSSIFENYPEIQIIISTMHSYRALANNLIEKGVNGYILKDDFEITNRLAQVVRDVYIGEVVISEEIKKQLQKKHPKTLILTKREIEILSYFFHEPGIETPEIADCLDIAISTVRNTLFRLYRKLGVKSKNAAIHKISKMGYSINNFPRPSNLKPGMADSYKDYEK
jgi:DNA-binding NarL/FixJ family response regulator